MKTQFNGFNTILVHAGEPRPLIEGAVTLPIFQSSTFECRDTDSGMRYIRLNNTPNHIALHEKLAVIEGGETALVTASGMAAISAALLAVLKQGDHLMVQSDLYGGTHGFITQDLPDMGIEADFFDASDPGSWETALTPQTRAIYVESISNPLMKVCDLEAVLEFSRKHSLISIIDNTFTSPVNYKAAAAGFDLCLHSCSKYLNGHSDILAGAVIGRKPLVDKAARKLLHLGGSLDPHACFLLQRGMKTLQLRILQHNDNALAAAQYLAGHPKVVAVHYPGLADSPYHEVAQRLFTGFGGVLSFEVQGGTSAAEIFIKALHLPTNGPSLGGVESLVTRPATSSHRGMSPEARRKAGISDGLIRFSTGIEDQEDLLADLEQALERV